MTRASKSAVKASWHTYLVILDERNKKNTIKALKCGYGDGWNAVVNLAVEIMNEEAMRRNGEERSMAETIARKKRIR